MSLTIDKQIKDIIHQIENGRLSEKLGRRIIQEILREDNYYKNLKCKKCDKLFSCHFKLMKHKYDKNSCSDNNIQEFSSEPIDENDNNDECFAEQYELIENEFIDMYIDTFALEVKI